MSDMFRSARLTYRVISLKTDLPLFEALQADVGYQNSYLSNLNLPCNKTAKGYMQGVFENLLGAIICISPSADNDDDSTSIGIGQLNHWVTGPYQSHHRYSILRIQILPEWQGGGCGTEAIGWVLKHALYRIGLHRVEVSVSGWNEGAIKLFQGLGFKEEGRKKEMLWHDGKWWDCVFFGILATEWADIQRQEL